jgi:hypothetical protein
MNATRLWRNVLILLGIGTGVIYASNTPPCQPTRSWCDPWSCSSGSINNPGTVTPSNMVICVGGSAGASVTGTTFNNGSKSRTCHDDCGNLWTDGPYSITYSPSNWFDPPIPSVFTNCGTFSFTAYVVGISGDSDCPGTVGPATVGTFTVQVEAVTGLSPSEGTLISNSPPTYLVCPGSNDVIVTATDCLGLPESQLPSCWSFTGGTAVGLGKYQRKVNESVPGPTTFTVTAGTSSLTIVVTSVDPSGPAATWQLAQPSANCPINQNPAVTLFSKTDSCGNKLEITCDGAYHYLYNGQEVGTCIYTCGINSFYYRMTADGARFHSTWHMTRDQVSPGCDQGTIGKIDWTVTQFDCNSGAITKTCREATPATYTDNWMNPNNTPNATTAGGPSTCE